MAEMAEMPEMSAMGEWVNVAMGEWANGLVVNHQSPITNSPIFNSPIAQ
jgi:hypothetical protein